MNKLIRFTIVLIGAGIAAAMLAQMLRGRQPCPEIQARAFGVPAEQIETLSDLLAKARRLNAAGRCAVAGSYASRSGVYQIIVTDGPHDATVEYLEFDREELKQ